MSIVDTLLNTSRPRAYSLLLPNRQKSLGIPSFFTIDNGVSVSPHHSLSHSRKDVCHDSHVLNSLNSNSYDAARLTISVDSILKSLLKVGIDLKRRPNHNKPVPTMRGFRSPCFTFVLFLLLSRATACTLFDDLVFSEQRRYLSYQERGLPREFVQRFFEDFLDHIYKYVQYKYGNSDLSGICLTWNDLNEFYGKVYDSSAIDRKIERLKTKFPDLSYIPPTTQGFMPSNARLEQESRRCFNVTYSRLFRGEVKSAAALPKTSQVIFDPARGKNLEVYNAHASRAPRMRALRLLRTVTAMVVTLELAEVSREYSTQLLRHAVAWLSTVFRALQADGADVEVPVLFLPMYRDEFARLARYGRRSVPEVTARDVESELGSELSSYCSIDAWGRLELVNWAEPDPAHVWTVEQTLFNASFLARVARRIGFGGFDARNYPAYSKGGSVALGWDAEPTARAEVPTSARSSPARAGARERAAGRQAGLCDTPTYEFVARAGASWEQQCCAAICCNGALMMQAGLSVAGCCAGCHQGGCDVAGTQLERLATVHLLPYGCNDGGYVPVWL